VGIGFDVHPLVEGRRLIIGGVEIPYVRGLEGHSDADALSHAVMDALLGASNLGNKGELFPSSDPQYKDMCSLRFLEKVAALLKENRWRILSVDSTIIAQRPAMSQFFDKMAGKMAGSLGVDVERVSVKATTTDHLGFVGREEGIAACAVALLEKVE
jgi:2-C-methyl-D-erythritol 2,4-cyclodiphosphate synthase